MCGIFAVLRDRAQRVAPSVDQLEKILDGARSSLDDKNLAAGMPEAAALLKELDGLLKSVPGVTTVVRRPDLGEVIDAGLAHIDARLVEIEAMLDQGRIDEGVSLEALNESFVSLRDSLWSIGHDRLRTAKAVAAMAGAEPTDEAIEAYTSVQTALSALDRLEVRGRDSAGVSLLVDGHGYEAEHLRELSAKRADPLFLDGATEVAGGTAVFVYKAAAEIGALGDNVRRLRASLETDELLREVVSKPGSRTAVVAHTRWASVGTVSEPNAHPVDSQVTDIFDRPYVVASLNGDVDNCNELKAEEGITPADDITTDAKVIPVMISSRLARGDAPIEAFRNTVDRFEGSVAIAAAVASEPDRLLLAVKGSGQGCYIGFGEDEYVVASEPYGLVEQCDSYLRIDGETKSSTTGKSGQVVDLRRSGAGSLSGVKRYSYGGEEIAIDERELVTPEITTRDVDRGPAPHFLLKEISEAPQSVRRTLRGKVAGEPARLRAALDDSSFPPAIRDALAAKELNQVIAIGQGTAAVASQSLISMIEYIAPGAVAASARPATELSGFGLRDDMSGVLVVAVSQSGTTTDTNRTVDLARSRGAKVIAIVNRRESDLTERADGVLYTSDGRDVEMSVASTKAFYSQVVACTLLAISITDAVGVSDNREVHGLLDSLRKLPDAMVKVLESRPNVAEAARRLAPSRRSWAIAGNGPNHIAAKELRIKLSELCYKSIACDVTEDKKHIDLSSEPLIFVCAAGLTGSNVSDVTKEVAIYKAHKATPIVVCSEGQNFEAPAVIAVPQIHPALDFLLSTMVGHIFGYEAALAIDTQAVLMRSARAVLDDVLAGGGDEEEMFAALRQAMAEPSVRILQELRSGDLDGHLSTSTAVRLAALLRASTGLITLDALDVELAERMTPWTMMIELLGALSAAVDELARPIDAVKHQAKTVTVGISRTEESLADNRLVSTVVDFGTHRDRLSYRSMRLLVALDPAVVDVNGYTRYEVDGDIAGGSATATVVQKGGVAADIESRLERDNHLSGTKHRAAYERLVTVGQGGLDGRSVIIVPEIEDHRVTGIMLLHVTFHPTLDAESARKVLTGYRGRYSALVDAVTETEPSFEDEVLERLPILDLLVEPVHVLADNWRH